MKITNVTPMVLGTAWRNLTFVKVETDEGLVGVGEVRALNRTDALLGYLKEAVPRYVLGATPSRWNAWWGACCAMILWAAMISP